MLRTVSNPLILQTIRSHEVARPYMFGLRCNLFVDFGSHNTNPKLSNSGAAVQTAVCSLLPGIGWLDRKNKEENFAQDCQSLLRRCSKPCPQLTRPGLREMPMVPGSRRGWAGCRRQSRLADPSKVMTYICLPCWGRGVTLRGWGFESSHSTPQVLQLSLKTG